MSGPIRSQLEKVSDRYSHETDQAVIQDPDIAWRGNVMWTNLVPNTRYTVSNVDGYDHYDAANPANSRYNPYMFRPYTFPFGRQFSTGSDNIKLDLQSGQSKFKLRNGATGAMSMIFPSLASSIKFSSETIRSKQYAVNFHFDSEISASASTNIDTVWNPEFTEFDTSGMANRLVDTDVNFFESHTLEFSYFNRSDGVDVISNVDDTSVFRHAPFFEAGSGTRSGDIPARTLLLPTQMTSSSNTPNSIDIVLSNVDYVEPNIYWNTVIVDTANVAFHNFYKATIGSQGVQVEHEFIENESLDSKAYTFDKLFPNTEYKFEFQTFENYADFATQSVVRYDIDNLPPLAPYTTRLSQFFTNTATDNIGLSVSSEKVTTILLNDDADMRVSFANAAFTTNANADMEYQLNVSLNGNVVGNKTGITQASTDFEMSFDSGKYFGNHDISVSAEYHENNWTSLGYIRPTHNNTWTPTVLYGVGGSPKDFSVPRITNNPFSAPLTTSLSLTETADTATIALNDAAFSQHPNITDKYRVRANVDGDLTEHLFTSANVSSGTFFTVTGLLPSANHTIVLDEFQHLRSDDTVSNIEFGPFLEIDQSFTTTSDSISLTYETISFVILNDEGDYGLRLANAEFYTAAPSQSYSTNFRLDYVVDNVIQQEDAANVDRAMDWDDVQDAVVQVPNTLTDGNYHITLSFTNTTHNVSVVPGIAPGVFDNFVIHPIDPPGYSVDANVEYITITPVFDPPFEAEVSDRYSLTIHVNGSPVKQYITKTRDEITTPFVVSNLVPNTQYTVATGSFKHVRSGTTNTATQVRYANLTEATNTTLSDNVRVEHDPLEKVLLNDDGFMNVTLGTFNFLKNSTTKSYAMELTLTDITNNFGIGTYSFNNIQNFINGNDLLFSNRVFHPDLPVYDPDSYDPAVVYLDFFTDYQFTLKFKNTTDQNIYATDESGNIVSFTANINASSGLTPATFTATPGYDSITVAFNFFDPVINGLTSDLYRYKLQVKQGFTQIGSDVQNDIRSTSFATETRTLSGLLPNRSYTVELAQFRHLKYDSTVSGIVTNDTLLQSDSVETSPGNETASFTLEKTLLNDQGEANLTMTGFSFTTDFALGNYTAVANVDGSFEVPLGNIATITTPVVLGTVGFYDHTSVNMALLIDNQPVFSNLDSDPFEVSVDSLANPGLAAPTFTLSRGDFLDIDVNFGSFSVPAVLTDSFSLDLVLSKQNEDSTFTVIKTENIPFTSANLANITFESDLLLPGTTYKVELANITHEAVNSSIPLTIPITEREREIQTRSGNIEFLFDSVYSDDIDVATGNVNAVFTGVDFSKGGLEASTFDLCFVFNDSVEVFVSESNIDANRELRLGIEELKYDQDYTVKVKYRDQDTQEFVKNPDASVKVTEYPGKTLTQYHYTAPARVVELSKDWGSATVRLADFDFITDFPNVSDSYDFGFNFGNVASSTDSWANLRNSVRVFDLVPDTEYNLALVDWAHTDEGSGFMFQAPVTANVAFRTNPDNATVTYDGHTREISGDTATISSFTVANVGFTSDANLNYTLNVHVDGNEYPFVIDNTFPKDLQIPIERNYFSDVPLVFEIINTTHGVASGNVVDIFYGTPFSPPGNMVAGNVGSESISLHFENFTELPSNVSDAYYANIRYSEETFVLTPVATWTDMSNPGFFTISNLESDTDYTVYLVSWHHQSGNMDFTTPVNVSFSRRTDPSQDIQVPRFRVASVDFRSVTVALDPYSPGRVVDQDAYNIELTVVGGESKLFTDQTAAQLGNLEYTFENLLPGNDYTVQIISFSNTDPTEPIKADLPRTEHTSTPEYPEPRFHADLTTKIVDTEGRLSVTLDNIDYSNADYDLTLQFVSPGQPEFTGNLRVSKETTIESIHQMELYPAFFDVSLQVHLDYTVSALFFDRGNPVVDPHGNVITSDLGSIDPGPASYAPPTDLLFEANTAESVSLRVGSFAPVPELPFEYYVDIYDGTNNHDFVLESPGQILRIPNLVPEKEYTFNVSQFNYNNSDLVFDNSNANVTASTRPDNVVFSYDRYHTTMANTGDIANVVFSGNLGFSSDAPTKAYDLEFTFNGGVVISEPNVHQLDSDSLTVQVNDLDYFSDTSVLIRYKNTTDSEATGNVVYAQNQKSFTANGAEPLAPPTNVRTLNPGVTTITVYLDGYTPDPVLDNRFEANIETNLGDLIHRTDVSWQDLSNADSGFETFTNLIPDTTYNISLTRFRNAEPNIDYLSPLANVEETTASDNIVFSFDTANVSSTMLNDNVEALVDKIVLPTAVFNTDAVNIAYSIELFKGTELISNVEASSGDLELTLGPGVHFFSEYHLTANVLNTTHGVVPVHTPVSFTLTAADPLVVPTVRSEDANTDWLEVSALYLPDQESFLHGIAPFLADNNNQFTANVAAQRVSDNDTKYFEINDTYDTMLSRFGNKVITLHGLEPNTDYNVYLQSLDMTGSNVVYQSPGPSTPFKTKVDTSAIVSYDTVQRAMSNVSSTTLTLTNVDFDVKTRYTDYDLTINVYSLATQLHTELVPDFYSKDTGLSSPDVVITGDFGYHANVEIELLYNGSTNGAPRIISYGAPPVPVSFGLFEEINKTSESLEIRFGNISPDLNTNYGIEDADNFKIFFEIRKDTENDSEFVDSNVETQYFNLSDALSKPTIDFTGLVPNTGYVVRFSGILKNLESDRLQMEANLLNSMEITTSSDNVRVTSTPTFTRTLHNEDAESNITVSNFQLGYVGTKEYRLDIVFRELNDQGTVSGTTIHQVAEVNAKTSFSFVNVNHFKKYSVEFKYFNTNDQVHALNLTDIVVEPQGNIEAESLLDIPLTFRTLDKTHDRITVSGFALTSPVASFTDNHSFDLVLETGPGTVVDRKTFSNKTVSEIQNLSHTFNSLAQDTLYTVRLDNYVHPSTLNNYFDQSSYTEGNVTTNAFTDVSVSYDRLLKPEIQNDDGHTQTLRFENFEFEDGNTGLAYDMLVSVGGNTPIRERDVDAKTGNLDIDISALGVDHFDSQNLLIYFQQGLSNVESADGSLVTQTPLFPAAANLAPPNVIDNIIRNVDSFSFDLSPGHFQHPSRIANSYHANLEYSDDKQPLVKNDWTTSNKTFQATNLVPNHTYFVELVEFQHYNGSINPDIQFANPVVAEEISTLSDEVHSQINGANVTGQSIAVSPVLGNDADSRVLSMTLPQFRFNTLATGKTYNMDVKFTAGGLITGTGTSGSNTYQVVDVHNYKNTASDLLLTFSEFYPKYFEDYTVEITYTNTADNNVPVTNSANPTDVVVETFTIQGQNPFNWPTMSVKAGDTTAVSANLALSGFSEIPDISNEYYANISYASSSGEVHPDSPYVTNGPWDTIKNIDIGNLAPGTQYTFQFDEFGHWNGAKNDAIQFNTPNPLLFLDITTVPDNPRSQFNGSDANIGYDNYHDDSTDVIPELNEAGQIESITFKHYKFSSNADSLNYDLVISFENTNNTSTFPVSSVQTNYSTASDLVVNPSFNLSYFQQYKVSFVYTNIYGPSAPEVFSLKGSDPFKWPTSFFKISKDAVSANLALSNFSNIEGIGNEYYVNISYTSSSGAVHPDSPYVTNGPWDTIKNIDIGNLAPGTQYTFQFDDFGHSNGSAKNDAIQFNTPNPLLFLDITTVPDNPRSQFNGNVANIGYDNYHDDSTDVIPELNSSGEIQQITFKNYQFSSNADSLNYDLVISFVNTNNATETFPVSSVQTNYSTESDLVVEPSTAGFNLSYFQQYKVSFVYTNIYGPSAPEVFSLKGSDPFNWPTRFTESSKDAVSANLALSNFSNIDGLNDRYYVNISYASSSGEVHPDSPYVTNGPWDDLQAITIPNLTPGTTYKFQFDDFGHSNGSAKNDAIQFNTPNPLLFLNITTDSDNPRSQLDGTVTHKPEQYHTKDLVSPVLNSSGEIQQITFKNYQFFTDAPSLRYDLDISFENTNTGTSVNIHQITNIQDRPTANLDVFNVDRFNLSYFQQYDVSFQYTRTLDNDITIENFYLKGSDPFDWPTMSANVNGDTTAVSVTLTFSGFSPIPGLNDRYYANIGYRIVADTDLIPHTINDKWANLQEITIDNLVPGTEYLFVFQEFAHYDLLNNRINSNIQFNTPSDVDRFFTEETLSDNPRSQINGNVTNIGYNYYHDDVISELNEAGQIKSITFNNYQFSSNADSLNYDLEIEFVNVADINATETFPVSSVQTNYSTPKNLVVNPSTLSYFQQYNVSFAYTRTLDNYITPNPENFSLKGSDPFPGPNIEYTKDVDYVTLTLTHNDLPIADIVDSYYANVSYYVSGSGSPVDLGRITGNWATVSNIPNITGLLPKTSYTFALVGFGHFYNDSENNNIPFGPTTNIEVITDNDTVYSQIGGSNIDSGTKDQITKVLNNQGHMSLEISDYRFFQDSSSIDYSMEITFEGNIYVSGALTNTTKTANVANVSGLTSLTLSNFVGFNLSYFEDYQVELRYKNTTNNEYAEQDDSTALFVETFTLSGSLFNWPTMTVKTSDTTPVSVTFTLSGFVPNTDISNVYYANISYTDIATSYEHPDSPYEINGPWETIQNIDIGNLAPGTTYKFQFNDFGHWNAGAKNDAILFSGPPPDITESTVDPNPRSKFNGNVANIGVDNYHSRDLVNPVLNNAGNIESITFKKYEFLSEYESVYNLEIQFRDISGITTAPHVYELSNVHTRSVQDLVVVPSNASFELSYFQQYDVSFVYNSNIYGPFVPEVFSLIGLDPPFPGPNIEYTKGVDYVTLTLTHNDLPIANIDDNYYANVSYYVSESGSPVDLDRITGNWANVSASLANITGLLPQTSYTFALVGFGHFYNDSENDNIPFGPTANIEVITDNDTVYSQIGGSNIDSGTQARGNITKVLNDQGHLSNIEISNYEFFKDSSIDYSMEITFEGNIYVSDALTNTTKTANVANVSGLTSLTLSNFVGFNLSYFEDYQVKLKYHFQHGEDTIYAQKDANIFVETFTLSGSPFVWPTMAVKAEDTTPVSVSFTLSGFVPSTDISNVYYANIIYTDTSTSTPYTIHDTWDNLQAITIPNLTPDTQYTFQFYDFGHSVNGAKNDAILFTTPDSLTSITESTLNPDPQSRIGGTTANIGFGNVHSSDLVNTVLRNDGNIETITFKDYRFSSFYGSAYTLRIQFTSGTAEHKYILANVDTDYSNASDLVVNPSTANPSSFYLSYFQQYDVSFYYDHDAYGISGPENFSLKGSDPFPGPNIEHTKGVDYVTLTLTHNDLPIANIDDSYYANVSYYVSSSDPESAVPWPGQTGDWANVSASLANITGLLPQTSYTFDLVGFGHFYNDSENDNIPFGPTANIEVITDNDTVYSQIGGSNIDSNIENQGNITKTLHEQGYLSRIDIANFAFFQSSSIDYSMEITFVGNIDDGNVALTFDTKTTNVANVSGLTSLTLSNFVGFNLSYFEDYQVKLKYHFQHGEDTIYAQKDANIFVETFTLSGSPFVWPTMAVKAEDTTPVSVSFTLSGFVPSTDISNVYYANIIYYTDPSTLTPYTIHDTWDNLQAITIPNLTPGTQYTFQFYDFGHSVSGAKNDAILFTTPDSLTSITESTVDPNPRSQLDGTDTDNPETLHSRDLVNPVLNNDGNIESITFKNYQFFTDADLRYDLLIRFTITTHGIRSNVGTHEIANIHQNYDTAANLEVVPSIANPSSFNLNYFQQYDVSFEYTRTLDDFKTTENFSLKGSDPFPGPNIEHTKGVDYVTLTLTHNDLPIANIDDNYYANVSYYVSSSAPESAVPWPGQTGDWANVSASLANITGLLPQTSYTFDLVGFGHFYNGIPFGPTANIEVITDNDTVYSQIGGSNIDSNIENQVNITKTLDDQGYLSIGVTDYAFSQSSSIDYSMEITFKGNVYDGNALTLDTKTTNVANVSDQDSLTLSNFVGFNLSYFETYQVELRYYFQHDGGRIYAQKDLIDQFVETFTLSGESPFAVPTLIVNSANTDTVVITLSNLDSLYPIHGIEDKYVSNVGYMKTSEIEMTQFVQKDNTAFGSIQFTFSGLVPNTDYKFKHAEFYHVLGDVIQMETNQPEVYETTASDNVSSIFGNVTRVFSGDDAYVANIDLSDYQFFTNTGSKVYDLRATIAGNLVGTTLETQSFGFEKISETHQAAPGLLSLGGWDNPLDWFRDYTLTLRYFNITDQVFATNSNIESDYVVETIDLPAVEPFPVPFGLSATPDFATGNITVDVTYTAPSQSITDAYSFKLVVVNDENPKQVVGEEIITTNSGANIADRSYSIGPITADTYEVELRDFVHYNAGGTPSRVQWKNSPTAGPVTFGNVSIHYDRILKPTLLNNQGHTGTLRFENFTFDSGGSDSTFDMLVRLEGQTGPDVTYANLPDESSSNVDVDISTLGVSHFYDANIEIRIQIDGEIVQRNGTDLLYRDTADAVAALVVPDVIENITPGVDSVSFDLSPGAFTSPTNIDENYHANIEILDEIDSVKEYKIVNDWSTTNTRIEIDDLIPNRNYIVSLKNFEHYYDGSINDTAIRFEDPDPAISQNFTTSSDRVYSTINNGSNIDIGYGTYHDNIVPALEVTGDGRVSTLTLPQFQFNTLATNTNYDMEVTFSGANIIYITTGSNTYVYSNVQNTTGTDIVLNFDTFYIKYFDDYNVEIKYVNTTDSDDTPLFATRDSNQTNLVVERFTLQAQAPFSSPNIDVQGNTAESVSFTLSGFDRILGLTDFYFANISYAIDSSETYDSYEVTNQPWESIRTITIPDLVPNTNYKFRFDEFGHWNGTKNDNIQFGNTDGTLRFQTTSPDNPRSQLNGTPTHGITEYTVSKTINDDGGVDRLTFGNYQFFTDAGSKNYTLNAGFTGTMLDLTTQTGNYVIPNISDTHKLSADELVLDDFHGFTLDYYRDYTVGFSYLNTNDDVMSNVEVFTLKASDPFPLPTLYKADANAESITVSFTNFSNRDNLTDSYYANVGYYKSSMNPVEVSYLTPKNGPLSSLTFQPSGLIPNTAYTFELAEFNHFKGGTINDNIQFDSTANTEMFTTENDNVSSTINEIPTHKGDGTHGTNVSTVLGENARVGTLTFKSYDFSTGAPSKDYDLTVSFTGTMLNSDVTEETKEYPFSNIEDHSGDLEFSWDDSSDFHLNYFEDYTVSLRYRNTTDSVNATYSNGIQLIDETFKLPRGADLEIPVDITNGPSAATSINLDISYTLDLRLNSLSFTPAYTYKIRATNGSTNIDSGNLTHATTSTQITGLTPDVNYSMHVVNFTYQGQEAFVFKQIKDLQMTIKTNKLYGPTTLDKGNVTIGGTDVWFGVSAGETGTVLGNDNFEATFSYASPEHSGTYSSGNVSNYGNHFGTPDKFTLSQLLPNTQYTITLTGITDQTAPNYTIHNSSPSVNVTTDSDAISYNIGTVSTTLANDDGDIGNITFDPSFGSAANSPYNYEIHWTVDGQLYKLGTTVNKITPTQTLNYFTTNYGYSIKVKNTSFPSATYYAKDNTGSVFEPSGTITGSIGLGTVRVDIDHMGKQGNGLELRFGTNHLFLPGTGDSRYESGYTPNDLYRLVVNIMES